LKTVPDTVSFCLGMDAMHEDQQRRAGQIVRVFQSMDGFAETNIISNASRGETTLEKREAAIDCQYAQAYLWARLMTGQANDLSSFVVALAASRTIFELSLDIAYLRKASDQQTIERFWTFASAFRARVFGKWHNITNQQGIERTRHMAQFYQEMIDSGELAATQRELRRLWPSAKGRWPDHWSGTNNLLDRAKAVGGMYPVVYAQVNAITSAFVHGNPFHLGQDYISTLRSFFILAYHASGSLFATATSDYLQAVPIFGAHKQDLVEQFDSLFQSMMTIDSDEGN